MFVYQDRSANETSSPEVRRRRGQRVLDRAAPRAFARRLALTSLHDPSRQPAPRRPARDAAPAAPSPRSASRPAELQGGENRVAKSRRRRRALQPQQRRRGVDDAGGAAGADDRDRVLQPGWQVGQQRQRSPRCPPGPRPVRRACRAHCRRTGRSRRRFPEPSPCRAPPTRASSRARRTRATARSNPPAPPG